ncbi:uncharacterized protein LOC142557972 [Dermacentor variabilis]|uniref:uncharacterized protein LOC142557972 n=1 Tax=Dermacentor variabilis TaxID=34621 RepID=UPI003F5BB4D1
MTNPLAFFTQILPLGTAVPAAAPDRLSHIVAPKPSPGACAIKLHFGGCALVSSDHVTARITDGSPPPPSTSAYIRRPASHQHFSGHVGWPSVNIMTNPLAFFTQYIGVFLDCGGMHTTPFFSASITSAHAAKDCSGGAQLTPTAINGSTIAGSGAPYCFLGLHRAAAVTSSAEHLKGSLVAFQGRFK